MENINIGEYDTRGYCYVTVQKDKEIKKTIEHDDSTYIDVDSKGEVVGIEITKRLSRSKLEYKVKNILKEYVLEGKK